MSDPRTHLGTFAKRDAETLRSVSGRWFGRPSLTARPDGTWVMVFRDAPGHRPSTDSSFRVAFSTDDGDTWTDDDTTPDGDAVEGFPHTRPDADVSDGTVKFHRGDLLFHVTEELEPFDDEETPRDRTRQLRSTDGGRSWTDEGILDPAGITSESLLLGQDDAVHPETGALYEGVNFRGTDRSDPHKKSGVVRTDDGGRSWEYVGDVTDFEDRTGEIGLTFVGGTLLAVLRDTEADRTYLRRSEDGGETWGPLGDATDSLGVFQRVRPYTPGDIGSDAHHDEWLYAVGRHVVGDRPAIVADRQFTAVATSPDAGETWYGPFALDDYGDSAYCDVPARPDGDLYLVTYGGPDGTDADLLGYHLREA